MLHSVLLVTVVVLGFEARAAHSQSLGDVARREAERRKEVAQPARVYTNDDLSGVEQPPAAPAPFSDPGTTPPPIPVATTDVTPERTPAVTIEESNGRVNFNIPATRPKPHEQYWGGGAKGLRDQLAKSSADLAAAESSLAALEKGPQTPTVARERSVVGGVVQRLQSEVRSGQQNLAALRTYAEMNKVPPEWIQ